MEVYVANSRDARNLARIHRNEIPFGFLTSLPRFVLEKFYEALIRSPEGVCVVAKEQGATKGFMAGTADTAAFARFFLLHFFWLAPFLLPSLFRGAARKVLENLRYAKKREELPPAELLAMAVERGFQGRGAAKDMFRLFVQEMERYGVKEFCALVGEDLSAAVSWYEKQGFRLLRTLFLHGKAPSRVYVYAIA